MLSLLMPPEVSRNFMTWFSLSDFMGTDQASPVPLAETEAERPQNVTTAFLIALSRLLSLSARRMLLLNRITLTSALERAQPLPAQCGASSGLGLYKGERQNRCPCGPDHSMLVMFFCNIRFRLSKKLTPGLSVLRTKVFRSLIACKTFYRQTCAKNFSDIFAFLGHGALPPRIPKQFLSDKLHQSGVKA